MFKILVIAAMDNLSDERAEFLINDRLASLLLLQGKRHYIHNAILRRLTPEVPSDLIATSFMFNMLSEEAVSRCGARKISAWTMRVAAFPVPVCLCGVKHCLDPSAKPRSRLRPGLPQRLQH
jgi:hypothetical protein